MELSYPFTPRDEIHNRIQRLQSSMERLRIDGVLIFQKADLFYFSGTVQQGQLYVPLHGNPVLMIRKSMERARAESPIESLVSISGPERIPKTLSDAALSVPRRLGLELDVIPARLYLAISDLFPGSAVVDVSDALRTLRSVKSPYELGIMREAARRADLVASTVPGLLKEGISEVELAGLVEAQARRLGHQGVVRMRLWNNELFYGHLMAGPGAAVPSYLASPTGGAALSAAVAQGPSSRPIRSHEPVLVDYVFAYNGYLADHTRIYAIGGLPDVLWDAHATALEIEDTLTSAMRPGISAGRIYELAMECAVSRGYENHFMGADPQRVRFVGHGIGLELDEIPFLARGQETLLELGMTVALEPKFVFPDLGVVGIENTHLITPSGAAPLTRCNPHITIV